MGARESHCKHLMSGSDGGCRSRDSAYSHDFTGRNWSREGAKMGQRIRWKKWAKLVALGVLLGQIYALFPRHRVQISPTTAAVMQLRRRESQFLMLATSTDAARRKLPAVQPVAVVQPPSQQSFILETPTNATFRKLPVVENLREQEVQEDPQQSRRIAVCLVGSLRGFELTGPSMREYVLDAYRDADVFVNAPVDAHVHKLTLLGGVPNQKSARLFVPSVLHESQVARELLDSTSSPHGIQGLLQYFNMVEGCWVLIEDHERRHGFRYDWVVSTRMDGYWNAPLPPIASFSPLKHHVPDGSDLGGLNDRLSIGTRETSEVALQRMSSLPQIHGLGYRRLNSETILKAQLNANHVEVELQRFPFCVLSSRRHVHPIGHPKHVPVASVMSKGPLNGAKCRPCTPQLVGKAAWQELNRTQNTRAGIGPANDVQLCDPREGVEPHWERIYDRASGPRMAELRSRMAGRVMADCLVEMKDFQEQWEVWDAPSPETLCAGLRAAVRQ